MEIAKCSNYNHPIFYHRELLKGALAVFKDDPNKYLSAQAEALSSLAYLCSKMGDWERGKEYLQKAEKALDTSSDPKYVSQC